MGLRGSAQTEASFSGFRSRLMRISIGLLLTFFGFFGFLPILGNWMLAVGLLVLSVDIAFVRQWRAKAKWCLAAGQAGPDSQCALVLLRSVTGPSDPGSLPSKFRACSRKGEENR